MRNYWRTKKLHYNLDTDRDGTRDYKDCQPFTPTKQHSREWEKRLQKGELIKRNAPDLFFKEVGKGWDEEKVVTRMLQKPGSSIDKIVVHHERISQIPGAIAFCAEDIQRTKEVRDYITKHELKDLGSEIQF